MVNIFIQIFNGVPFLNQGGCSFLTDASHTGDVVGAVSHECFQVNHGQGSKAVFLLKASRCIGDGFLVGNKANGDILIDEL